MYTRGSPNCRPSAVPDHHFSRRTPLNFFALFFTAMNSPDVLSRFVQAGSPLTAVLRWVRFFTAPLRALSPTGLFTAIIAFYVDHRNFMPLIVKYGEAPLCGRRHFFCDPGSYELCLPRCLCIVHAIDASRVNKPMSIYHVEVVARHRAFQCVSVSSVR
jgi:hypothetical protein